MPSYKHELLLALFRNGSESVMKLLRKLRVALPNYDEVRTESAEINDLKPAEYRADLVLFLYEKSRKSLGIIVEVQLDRDKDKKYSWPAYIANLRARHRCPVCLLVITINDGVARWAEKSINLGPGTQCTPCVVGPSNIPPIVDSERAKANVELAVLSAISCRKSRNTTLAKKIATAALHAIAHIDNERLQLYYDLLSIYLQEAAPEVLDVMVKNSLGFEYQSDFARRWVAQGLAEGMAEGLAKGMSDGQISITIKLLSKRFGPLSEEIQTRVRGAKDAQRDAIIEQLLTAPTLEQALSPLDEVSTATGGA